MADDTLLFERNEEMCMQMENVKISVLNEETSSFYVIFHFENVFFLFLLFSLFPQCYKALTSVVLGVGVVDHH